LCEIKTWAETVKSNGDKIAERAGRMRTDLAKEIESLDRHIQAMKASGTPV
jgi:biotin operon repressor